MRMFIARLLLAVAAVFGLSALAATPAQADAGLENGYMEVCNSSGSVADITVYDGYGAIDYLYHVADGDCQLDPPDYTRGLRNVNNNVRVDVEDHEPQDVDSYKIGHISEGYGPCHEDSENHASDPPNSYEPYGARYRNYTTGNCTSV